MSSNGHISHSSTAVISFLKGLAASPLDYRCPVCGRLLWRGRLIPGSYVETRCAKCGRIVRTKGEIEEGVQ